MVAIILNGQTYDYIVDTLFSESNDVSESEFLNQDTVTLDENVWNRGPLRIIYVMRVTSAEKWTLDQLLLAHTAAILIDTKYDINGNVWISKIEAEWNPDNHNYPWTLTLDLILIELITCPDGEQIGNGGFESGEFPPWVTYGDPWVTSWDFHSGLYGCTTWEIDDAIEQEFTPIAYGCIESFVIWTKQDFDNPASQLEVTVTYDDDTTLQWIEGGRTHVEWVETDVKAKLDPTKKVKKIKLRQKTGIHTLSWTIDDVSLIGTG